jgi:anti-sigma factor RsiW
MDDASPELGGAARELMMSERRRLGATPSPEELIAYADGTLPAAGRERVEDAIAADPETARAVAALRELPEPEPGVPGEGELAAGWEELRGRLAGAGFFDRPQARRPGWALATAASVALLALSFWAGALWGPGRHSGGGARLNPLIVTLWPEGDVQRGDGTHRETLREGTEAVVMVLPLIGAGEFEDHRVTVSAGDGRRVWESGGLVPSEDGPFTVELPAALLPSGRYRVTLRGESAGRSEPLASYRLELVVE